MTRYVIVTSLLLAIGCGPKPAATEPEVRPQSEGEDRPRWTEADVEKMIVRSSCASVSDCATAAVGLNTCGETKKYVIYCKTSTDAKRFDEALDYVNARAVELYGDVPEDLSRQCVSAYRPPLELVDGTCKEKEVEDAEIEVVD